MNEHSHVSDMLPLYVNGYLDDAGRRAVERHLDDCAACRSDLALWRAVSAEITAGGQALAAPRGLAERALADDRGPGQHQPGAAAVENAAGAGHMQQELRRIWDILRSQMSLVHREIWPASALVIGLGYIVALISERSGFVYAVAPLVAAVCISLIYGPENDPAYELALSTPTSPRQILLARLALVFSYNLALVLAATLGMLPLLADQASQPLMGSLVLSWLAPMAFLSAAALTLSLWVGAPNAISVTYIAWLVQLIAGPLRSPYSTLALSPRMLEALAGYQSFWQASPLLLGLSALFLAAALWLAGRKADVRINPA